MGWFARRRIDACARQAGKQQFTVQYMHARGSSSSSQRNGPRGLILGVFYSKQESCCCCMYWHWGVIWKRRPRHEKLKRPAHHSGRWLAARRAITGGSQAAGPPGLGQDWTLMRDGFSEAVGNIHSSFPELTFLFSTVMSAASCVVSLARPAVGLAVLWCASLEKMYVLFVFLQRCGGRSRKEIKKKEKAKASWCFSRREHEKKGATQMHMGAERENEAPAAVWLRVRHDRFVRPRRAYMYMMHGEGDSTRRDSESEAEQATCRGERHTWAAGSRQYEAPWQIG
ncbi:hypothetical protein IWZ01DRAFT_206850 [Phyllosticta capitalensis]